MKPELIWEELPSNMGADSDRLGVAAYIEDPSYIAAVPGGYLLRIPVQNGTTLKTEYVIQYVHDNSVPETKEVVPCLEGMAYKQMEEGYQPYHVSITIDEGVIWITPPKDIPVETVLKSIHVIK
jgi:hypothetical protein